MHTYEHKQISPWPQAALGAFILLRKRRPSLLGLGLALLAMQGSALKTRVDGRGVSWNFGLSLPLFEIPFDDIADVYMTETAPWQGFGVNWTPQHGWLWKISGRDAVTIRKKNGGIVTLGSDDAAGLFGAITSRASRV